MIETFSNAPRPTNPAAFEYFSPINKFRRCARECGNQLIRRRFSTVCQNLFPSFVRQEIVPCNVTFRDFLETRSGNENRTIKRKKETNDSNEVNDLSPALWSISRNASQKMGFFSSSANVARDSFRSAFTPAEQCFPSVRARAREKKKVDQ